MKYGDNPSSHFWTYDLFVNFFSSVGESCNYCAFNAKSMKFHREYNMMIIFKSTRGAQYKLCHKTKFWLKMAKNG